MEFTPYILSQIIGFIALGIGTLSFQLKNQKMMFLANEISNAIWILHYILLGTYTGAFVMAIAVIRTIIAVFIKPDWKIPVIFIALTLNLLFCILSPEDYWYKYLPFLAAFTYSIAVYNNEHYSLSRCITFVTMSIWFAYGAFILSFAEMTESLLMIGSILIGFWRHKRPSIKLT